MTSKSHTVAVASRSFSRHPQLRAELEAAFPGARFNDAGASLRGEELAEFLADVEIAILALETVDPWLLDRLPRLRGIAKFGVGLDMIDVDEVARRGMQLEVEAGANAQSVAELVILLTLACKRRLVECQALVSDGRWVQVKGSELSGNTVGLVGYGQVGKAVARLFRAFGCKVIAYDLDPAMADAEVEFVEFEELLRRSDVVSLHVPLVPGTRDLIGARELGLMRRTSIVINTSRGGILDERALASALREDRIAGAALDVLVGEPNFDLSLVTVPNLVVTPHIGGSTEQAILRMGRVAIDGARRIARSTERT